MKRVCNRFQMDGVISRRTVSRWDQLAGSCVLAGLRLGLPLARVEVLRIAPRYRQDSEDQGSQESHASDRSKEYSGRAKLEVSSQIG